jgi:hypothetical protein
MRQEVMNDRWLTYLLAASLAYLAVLTFWGRFPNIDGDEIWYKAAGREWATTGRFAAPELSGAYGLEPPLEEVWLAYPPLYPFLFGCVVKMFGFGWRVCVAFDAVIHSCLALLTFGVARGLSAGGDRRAAFWAGLSVLPLGVAGRPDELALTFGMAGLLPLVRLRADAGCTLSWASAAVASGGLFGLCAGTSSAAAILLGLIALIFLVTRVRASARFIFLGSIWAGTAATVFAALLAPILLDHPDAYRQYPALMKVIFQSDTRSHWEKIAALLTIGRRVSIPVFGVLLVGLATVVNSLRRSSLRQWALLWLGPLFGAVFLLIFDPNNNSYPWFLGPYVLAAAIVTLADPRLAPERLAAWVSRGVVVLLVLYGSIETAKQTIVLATLPDAQSIQYNARQIRDLIPRESTVATYEAWWFLGSDYTVYDPIVSPSHWSQIDFVVVQGHPRSLERYAQEHFRLIKDNLNQTPYKLFGVPLSRSQTGFGARVFARQNGGVAAQ